MEKAGVDVISSYAHVIQAEARKHDVPPRYMERIMYLESRGKWWAKGPAGEVGLFQILPSVAKTRCPLEASDLWTARKNIACAARILKWQYKRCGNWPAAISAYNGSRFSCAVTRYWQKVDQ